MGPGRSPGRLAADAAGELKVWCNYGIKMNKLWSFRYEPFLLKRTFDELKLAYNPLNVEYLMNPFTKSITIISDTHCNEMVIDHTGDFLIHCGDFTNFGTKEETSSFLDWFSKQPFTHKIFIGGNHDTFCETEEFAIMMEGYSGLTYLNDSLAILDGLRIFGMPGTPKVSGKFSAFTDTRENLYEKYKKIIPHGLDILITHGPPYGYCDASISNSRFELKVNLGDVGLLIDVCDKKPKIHAFGHIHHGYGAVSNGDTTFINASACDNNNRIANKPVQLVVADARSP